MSKAERLSDKIERTKLAVMIRDGWACQFEDCGVFANQCAHILPNDSVHLKRFGDRIINHPANMKAVCGLKHNAAVQVNYRGSPLAAEAHAEEVRRIMEEGE